MIPDSTEHPPDYWTDISSKVLIRQLLGCFDMEKIALDSRGYFLRWVIAILCKEELLKLVYENLKKPHRSF